MGVVLAFIGVSACYWTTILRVGKACKKPEAQPTILSSRRQWIYLFAKKGGRSTSTLCCKDHHIHKISNFRCAKTRRHRLAMATWQRTSYIWGFLYSLHTVFVRLSKNQGWEVLYVFRLRASKSTFKNFRPRFSTLTSKFQFFDSGSRPDSGFPFFNPNKIGWFFDTILSLIP